MPVITLPGLFELAKADRISLLKVDIEGSENELFSGATPEVLTRINKIALEYHDHLRPGTLERLKERLSQTHNFRIDPADSGIGCGVMLAHRR